MWNHQRWLRMTLVMKPLSTLLHTIHFFSHSFQIRWFSFHKCLLCFDFHTDRYANIHGHFFVLFYRYYAPNGMIFNNGHWPYWEFYRAHNFFHGLTKQIDEMSWIFYVSFHCDRKLVDFHFNSDGSYFINVIRSNVW